MNEEQRADSMCALIAIVDDDKSVCRAMVRLLTAHSFRAEGHLSAASFIKSLDGGVTPACLITDLQMKGMTGLELLRHLAGVGLTMPTIVITANDDPGMRHRCELAGAAFVLIKPIDAEALMKAVRSVLGDRMES